MNGTVRTHFSRRARIAWRAAAALGALGATATHAAAQRRADAPEATRAATSAAVTPERDQFVEGLLRQMTLEEKVGEMTQLTIQAVSRTEGTPTREHELDPAKLEDAILRYHVGSMLNVWDVAFTPQHWHQVIRSIQDVARRSRLKIPVLYGIDAVHGNHYMVGGTLFPQNIALAATWNPELVRRSNEITAYETRAAGIPWNFSPVLDLARQPLWSRFFETFGEDVYLTSTMGAAAVRGQQGGNIGSPLRVAATGKHFLGYSMPLSGKDRSTAWIPDRQLYEFFVPSFQAAMDSGLATVMINSGDINGEPVHASHRILTGLLRERMGFQGVAVSDWEDIIKLHTQHHVAPTQKEAVRMAVMAGVDMSMVPYSLDFPKYLLELVREGSIPESRIDLSVRRILRLKYDLGLFRDAYPDARLTRNIGSAASQAVSRRAAEESVTLLKNDGVLPLARGTRVLVTGPGATSLPVMHGAWTHTWQGMNTAMYSRTTKSPLQAVTEEAGAANVTFVPGSEIAKEIDIQAAVRAAQGVDVVLVFLGENPSAEGPGDIEDLSLPEAQRTLAQALEATGKPVVLVMFENRPQIVREVEAGARAVVMGYETGPYGGTAVADILWGDVNPSGRLPFTYPRYTGSLVHYDNLWSEKVGQGEGMVRPQWEFGYGLSYTTFAYSGLRLDRAQAGPNGTVTATVTVQNTGRRAGQEVVQLYVRDLYASIAPPNRRLRGFQKITLAAGETKTVTFPIRVQDLAFIGMDNTPVVEPGDFEVLVGGQMARFTVAQPPMTSTAVPAAGGS